MDSDNIILVSDKFKSSQYQISFLWCIVDTFSGNIDSLEILKKTVHSEIILNQLQIEESINSYSNLFKFMNFDFPLNNQLKSVIKKGFPTIQPYIDILLMLEMKFGILMGCQDANKISFPLILDLSYEGESFLGMRKPITCKRNELILRDNEGIIASFFQGPDIRTQVQKETNRAIYFAFVSGQNLDTTEIVFNKIISIISEFFIISKHGVQKWENIP